MFSALKLILFVIYKQNSDFLNAIYIYITFIFTKRHIFTVDDERPLDKTECGQNKNTNIDMWVKFQSLQAEKNLILAWQTSHYLDEDRWKHWTHEWNFGVNDLVKQVLH